MICYSLGILNFYALQSGENVNLISYSSISGNARYCRSGVADGE